MAPGGDRARDGVRDRVAALSSRELWGLAFRFAIAAAVVGVGVWLVFVLHGVLVQMLLAIVLATGLARLTDGLEGLGLPRWAAALGVYTGLIAALAVVVMVVVPPALDAVESLVQLAPAYGEMAAQALDALQERFPGLPALDDELEGVVRGLSSQLGAIASQALALTRVALDIFDGLLAVLLVTIIALYLILDREGVSRYLLGFVPPARRARVEATATRMTRRTGGWLLGQVTLMAVVGVTCYVGLSLIGVPFAVLLALVAAAGEIGPILGPIVAAIPAVAVAATQSPLQALLVLGFYVVIQQIESYVLAPRIMGRAVKIHPLAVLLAVLLGKELLGVVGALAAVPVAAAVAILLEEVRSEPAPDPAPEQHEAHESETPQEKPPAHTATATDAR